MRSLFCAILFGLVSVAAGQSPEATPAALPVAATAATQQPVETAETIDQGLKEIENSDLDDAAKSRARDFYQQARQEIEQQGQRIVQKQQFLTRAAQAPQRRRELERLQLGGTAAVDLTPPANASIAALQQMLDERQTALQQVDELVRTLDAEPQRRSMRRVEIPKEIAALRTQLEELNSQLLTPTDPGESALLTAARRTLLRSRQQNREALLAALEAELAAYDAESEVLTLERNHQRSQQASLTEKVQLLTREISARRQNEALRRHERITRQLETVHPALRHLAEANFERSEKILQRGLDITQTVAQLAQLKEQQKKWAASAARTKRRVKRGSSETTVQLLRSERQKLPDALAQQYRSVAERQAIVQQLQSEMNDLQDASDDQIDVEQDIERLRQEMNLKASPEEEEPLTQQIRALITMRRELLTDHLVKTTDYFDALVALNEAGEQLAAELQQYQGFINERIFWIPSAAPLWRDDMRDVGALLGSLARLDTWWSGLRQISAILVQDAQHHPGLAIGVCGAVAVLLMMQRSLRRRLADAGVFAARGNCLTFLPTLHVALLTALISLPWGLLMAFLAWRLDQDLWLLNGDTLALSAALSAALVSAAKLFVPLEVFRQVCRRKGLGESHFHWSERMLAPLRLHLRWLLITTLVLTLLTAGLGSYEPSPGALIVARWLFIIQMFVLALFVQRVLRPPSGILQEHLSRNADGWMFRLRFLWYPLMVLTPLVLATVSALGYSYTAWHLAMRVHRTVVIVMGLCVLGSLLFRWLLISRRQLAARQAVERQRHMQQQQALRDDTDQPLTTLPEAAVDLTAINKQTRTLIRSLLVIVGGMMTWFVWVDVLPALAVLRDYAVYTAEGIEPGVIVNVTLADLLRALIVLAVTWIGARNLPGLVEIFLLRNLPLDTSVRYAITTIGRYVIAVAGVVIVSSMLGFSWRRAQWLVAALGVGLGFGLQEIFANLVSGIILLFERPIRVGDIITLGEVTGQVTRIRIRATTLTDWDRKELIVPNKDLITGRLLNWTLSDQVTRITLQIGIALGSNVARARELILEIARNHPDILADPAPNVTFEGFVNSTMQLVLRAYLARLDLRLPTTNDLHMQINERFKQEQIDIALPQLDIHVRDCAPLPLQHHSFARANGDGRGSHLHQHVL